SDGESVAQPRTEPVDERSGDPIGDGVGQHEREDYARIGHVAHMKLLAQDRGGDGERLAIEIIDDCSPEYKADHQPAKVGAGRAREGSIHPTNLYAFQRFVNLRGKRPVGPRPAILKNLDPVV